MYTIPATNIIHFQSFQIRFPCKHNYSCYAPPPHWQLHQSCSFIYYPVISNYVCVILWHPRASTAFLLCHLLFILPPPPFTSICSEQCRTFPFTLSNHITLFTVTKQALAFIYHTVYIASNCKQSTIHMSQTGSIQHVCVSDLTHMSIRCVLVSCLSY
jgi:hypothetical protein